MSLPALPALPPNAGRTRTILTQSVCPVYVLTQYPVATSHIFIVLSREQETM